MSPRPEANPALRTFPLRLFGARKARAVLDEHPFDRRDFEPALNTRLLVLQSTPFCNIDCDYCYLPNRHNPARMSVLTARLAARRLAEDDLVGPSLTVIWHAGEPLTAPPAFYEEAFAAIADELGSGCEISHSIQTNATLIDDRWCELFRRHGVRVGVSVDGPAFVHDRHRTTRDGKGTHRRLLRGVAKLRQHGIAHHAIAVVTADSLAHADAIHAFFAEQGIHDVGFNFDEAEGVHSASSLEHREQEYAAFVERMLLHMQSSAGSYQVRELTNAFRLIRDGAPTYRWRGEVLPENGQTMPFAMISVAWNGDFSTFSPELLGQANVRFDNFRLGNVERESYLAAANNAPFRALWTAVVGGVDACRQACPYFGYCGGGSPANKLYENSDIASAETLYCRNMIKRPFDTVLSHLETTIAASTSR